MEKNEFNVYLEEESDLYYVDDSGKASHCKVLGRGMISGQKMAVIENYKGIHMVRADWVAADANGLEHSWSKEKAEIHSLMSESLSERARQKCAKESAKD